MGWWCRLVFIIIHQWEILALGQYSFFKTTLASLLASQDVFLTTLQNLAQSPRLIRHNN